MFHVELQGRALQAEVTGKMVTLSVSNGERPRMTGVKRFGPWDE